MPKVLATAFAAVALLILAAAPAYADPPPGNAHHDNPAGNSGNAPGHTETAANSSGGNNSGGQHNENAGGPPGNNGTVKIVNDQGDAQDDPDNDPHVCLFHIFGFNFDANQGNTWDIAVQPPGGGPLSATQAHGTWNAGTDGKFDARPLAQPFPNGHYKLTVNTGMGAGKHKVFWVRCATPPTAGSTTGTNSSSVTTANSAANSGAEIETQASAALAAAAAINAAANAGTNAAVAGLQTAPQQIPSQAAANGTTTPGAVAGVQSLPSTSTLPDVVPLALLGFALMAAGGTLLRRHGTI